MSDNTALLIIDVQFAMFAPEDPAYCGNELLERIARLIARARTAGIPVIYIQHDGSAGHRLAPGAPGWPIHPAITPAEGEAVVHKRYPDSFLDTDLQHRLELLGVRHLVIAGMQTEYCVDTTCRRAYSLGYDVTLVQDGHSTWDTADLTAAQIIAHHNLVLGNGFATLRPAAEIEFAPDRQEGNR